MKAFLACSAKSRVVEKVEDIDEGWDALSDTNKAFIRSVIDGAPKSLRRRGPALGRPSTSIVAPVQVSAPVTPAAPPVPAPADEAGAQLQALLDALDDAASAPRHVLLQNCDDDEEDRSTQKRKRPGGLRAGPPTKRRADLGYVQKPSLKDALDQLGAPLLGGRYGGDIESVRQMLCARYTLHAVELLKPPPPRVINRVIMMRRIGDASWRRFALQKDAAKAFGIAQSEVSHLVNDRSKATGKSLLFEARRVTPPPEDGLEL